MLVPSILAEALVAIAAERGGQFNRSLALADRLLAEFGETNPADRLSSAIADECPCEIVADLFGILAWSTSDNGAALSRTTEEWLRAGEDPRRIRVALHFESFPFLDKSEMERVLRAVAVKHPEIAARCEDLIESRRRLPE